MNDILKRLKVKWYADDYGETKDDLCLMRNQEATSAADIIERLTAERDEARRMVCRSQFTMTELQHDYANDKGWDCFKEDGK